MDKNSPINQKIGAAWTTLRAGNHTAAVSEFEMALSEDRDNLDALYGLGLALKVKGDNGTARSKWERALELATARLEKLGTEHSVERERVFMTTAMLKQRLQEISG